MNCLGCKLANNKIKTKSIYEDDNFNVILDIDPISDGHLLILPKKHIENLSELISIRELNSLIKLLKKKLEQKGYGKNFSICINEGEINELSHTHIHLIPRKVNDKLLYESSNAKKDINEVFNSLK